MATIVIVTYNSAEVIERCLDACECLLSVRVIVVDNASTDSTVSLVRRRSDVTLISNRSNLGFAAAVNQGFRAAKDDAVLLLNPDASPIRGIDLLEHSVCQGNVGAATGALKGEDGEDQREFHIRSLPTGWTLAFEALGINRLWPGNPVNRRYRPFDPRDVEQPAAAFLMVRKEAWTNVGGFDEQFYPVWFEDVDFCKRLKDAGFEIRFIPEAEAHHVGGHSASKLTWGDRQLFWYGSLLRYASKHLPAKSSRAVGLAVMVASFLRMFTSMFQFGISEPVAVYSKVVRLAWGYLRRVNAGNLSLNAGQSVKEQLKQS